MSRHAGLLGTLSVVVALAAYGQQSDVISREVSVRAGTVDLAQVDVVSREVSVRAGTANIAQVDVVSREVSVRAGQGGAGVAQVDVIGREVSVFVPAPDLMATITAGPSSAVAGVGTITVVWTVTNLGASPARGPWTDRVSIVPLAGGTELQLGTEPVTGDLAPGASYSRSRELTIPAQAAGEYQLKVCADVLGNVFELSIEANNCATQPLFVTAFPRPDLAVTVVDPPPTANDGQPASLAYTVTNVGTAAATGSWNDWIYLSTDAVYDGASTDLEFGPFPRPNELGIGESYSRTVQVTIPAGLNGDHWFIVRSGPVVTAPTEQTTDNNLRVASAPTLIYQPNKPDLDIVRFETVPAGGTLYVTNPATVLWEVRNADDDGTASGEWTDQLYLSLNSTFEPGTDLPLGPPGGFAGSRGPGQSYLQTRTFTLPATPGTFWVFLVVDVADAIPETDSSNNLGSYIASIVAPSYTAEIDTPLPFSEALTPGVLNGLPVPITGRAVDRTTLQPVPNAPVSIRVVKESPLTRRVFTTTTDGSGNFSFTHYPLPAEAGAFTVYADHPAVLTDIAPVNPPGYTLLGLRSDKPVLWKSLEPNRGFVEQIPIRNLGNTAVGDILPIQVEVVSKPDYLTVDASFPSSLSASEVATLTLDVHAVNGLIEVESFEVRIRVPVEGVYQTAATILVNTQVTALKSNLVASVGSITGVMEIGGQSISALTIRNTGGNLAEGVVANISIEGDCRLNNRGYEIVQLLTPPRPNDGGPAEGILASGGTETFSIQLGLFPGASVRGGESVCGVVRVYEVRNQTLVEALAVPFQFFARSDRQGTLSLRVEDELTYYAQDGNALDGSGPLVAGARVELVDPVGVNPSVTLETTSRSLPLEKELVEGYYRMTVSAPAHGSYTTVVRVGPGAETPATVFLPIQSVSYEWSVVPTDIDDEYEVVITAVFETYVPVPRLIVTPKRFVDGAWTPFPSGSLVDLDEVTSGETILIEIYNDGLIAALGAELITSAVPGFQITPIFDPSSDLDCGGAGLCLGAIGAHQTLEVPVRIDRPVGRDGAVDCNAQVTWGVQHYIWCGEKRYYWTPVYYQYPRSDCGSGAVTGGFPPSSEGVSSGGGGSPYFFLPTYDVTVTCGVPPEGTDTPPPTCPPGQCCSLTHSEADPPDLAGALAQGSGAGTVILPTGEVLEFSEDLSVPGRGTSFTLQRTYTSKRSATSAPQSAFGFGWDHNWNASLSRSGPNVILREGNGRADLYEPEPSGSWVRSEFFRRIDRNPDGTYTVLFPDRTQWHFHAVNGGVLSGKLASIEDRNGNRLRANYDASGRLTSVTDTLDRTITFAYNAQGLIESVTDFANRQVLYAYYGAGDPNGNAGDLKSVTSPVVTGTPTGNDFPEGTTRVYTYSTGTGHMALDHNLLTIRDENGRVFVENTYHATTDPLNRDFDRVIRQRLGDEGDIVDIYHVPVVPTFQNRNAIRIIVVNDRVGNVREYDYDVRNRLVAKREYTGRAFPDLPTTLVANRPQGPLHGNDVPLFYETVYEWNTDSLLVRRIDPAGNETEYEYESSQAFNPGVEQRLRGNLRRIRRVLGSHPEVGNETELVESFTYVANAGGCCGSDWLETYTDPRGHVTIHEYDISGNRTQTTYPVPGIVENWEYNEFGQRTAHIWPRNGVGSGYRQRDEYRYHSFGPQRGYLSTRIEDVTTAGHPNGNGFEITTTYEYDLLGRVIREVDPRGHDKLYVHNAKGQLVRELSPQVTLGSITRRQARDYHYDANGNVVRIDVENVDEAGLTQANTHFTTILEYDTLNRVTATFEEELPVQLPPFVRSSVGLDLASFVVTRFEYDANRNQTFVRKGEANADTQPDNVVERRYDERDLVYQVVRAPGHALESVAQTDYDGNRRPFRSIDGKGSGDEHATTRVFDAFGRAVQVRDPMGNVTTNDHDACGNVVHVLHEGQLSDVPGSAGNRRLAESSSEFDELDRLTRTDRAFFSYATAGGQPIGDGLSTTLQTYTDRSALASVTDDRGHTSTTTYDSAGRRHVQTDARGNSATYSYDPSGNVLVLLELDLSDVPGAPVERFRTTYVYDALDRLIESNQHEYDTATVVTHMEYRYDSRGNRVRQIDALENIVRWTYDGLSRELDTVREMTATGIGGTAPFDTIVTSKVWDKSSRLLRQIDDNQNPTTYVYDPLDRKVGNVYADATSDSTIFDAHDNAIVTVDANGTVVECSYDDGDRLTGKEIQVAEGVSDDTTFELYRYDGLGRLVEATDDDSVVLRTYDSLGNLTLELQSGQPVAKTFDGVGNALTLTYPSGRVVTTTYDALNRKDVISDQDGFIADHAYVGSGRTHEIALANGTTRLYGYDGLRRTTRTALEGSAGLLADRTNSWDAMSNKTGWQDLIQSKSAVFEYDSIYRLVRSERRDGGVLTDEVVYELDGVGNRLTVTENGSVGRYTCDSFLSEPADCGMNQYSTTPVDVRSYDRNGNLVSLDPVAGGGARVTIKYDHSNRMTERIGSVGVEATATNYDPFGRRVQRIQSEATGSEVLSYFYDDWEVVEEQSGQATATYALGQGLDRLVARKVSNEAYYYFSDDLGSVLAVASGSGNLVEGVQYGDYGLPSAVLAIGGGYLFTGRPWDIISASYWHRSRFLEPAMAGFTSRDSLGVWGDMHNVGNARVYAGNSPAVRVDPYGQMSLFDLLENAELVVTGIKAGPRAFQIWKNPRSMCEDDLFAYAEFAGSVIIGGIVVEAVGYALGATAIYGIPLFVVGSVVGSGVVFVVKTIGR